MNVEAVTIDSLTLDPRNARLHEDGIEELVASLTAFGQQKPLVVWHDIVIAGNGLLIAATQLGWKKIEINRVPHRWSYAKAQAYALTDNRTAELSKWDMPVLAEVRLEVEAAGWDMGQFGFEVVVTPPVTLDLDITPESAPAKTKRGDIWILGPHRVMAGDCRRAEDVAKLLDGRTVNLAFTSPPYAEQRAYDKASGFEPIPPDEYVAWFEDVAANVRTNLAVDGSWFVNIKPSAEGLDTELYVFDLVLAHVRHWGWHFATEYCWERNGVPKSVSRRFKNQFEPIYQFSIGDWKMRPEAVQHESDNVPVPFDKGAGNTSCRDAQGGNGPLFGGANMARNQGRSQRKGGTGRAMADVQGMKRQKHGSTGSGEDEHRQGSEKWEPGEFIGPGMAYPGNRLPTFMSTHEATGHTAAFPVGLPEFFVRAYTDAGDVVYDPFMGSGSTLMAAHHQDRVGLGMEISAKYVDIICLRFEQHTGIVPVRASTKKPVSFLSA